MKLIFGIVVIAALGYFLFFKQSRANVNFLVVGGIYSVRGSSGYKIVKVLRLDRDTVHVTLYKNRFDKRPMNVAPESLTYGMTVEDLEKGNLMVSEIGAAHLPFDANEFAKSEPEFLLQQSVEPEELESYYEYFEQSR